MSLRVTFVGCGDAFGSGGRFNTCFMVDDDHGRFLMDCGATSLVALKSLGVDPNSIDTILITHLHGDHFGGLPFFLMDGRFNSGRQTPLTIAGPAQLAGRVTELGEALFPGYAAKDWTGATVFQTLEPGVPRDLGPRRVTAFEVDHPVEGSIATALRVATSGRVVAYSGDTQWTEALIPAARDADLFICECYYADEKDAGKHMNFPTLLRHQEDLGARRLILTHMGADMLSRVGGLGVEYATDGKVVEV